MNRLYRSSEHAESLSKTQDGFKEERILADISRPALRAALIVTRRRIGQAPRVNWVIYASGAALALAVADVMVKLAAGRIPNSLALLLYGTVPFVTGAMWFLVDRSKGTQFAIYQPAIVYGIGVGVTYTLVTICLYVAFQAGAPISLASPLVRLGGLVVASAVGVLLWKEPLTARYLLGLVLACAGLYLMMTRSSPGL